MATLTEDAKREARRFVAKLGTVTWSKPQINAVLQAIEDWFDKAAVQSSLNTDIEAAASGVFTTAQKKKLVKYWMRNRWERE